MFSCFEKNFELPKSINQKIKKHKKRSITVHDAATFKSRRFPLSRHRYFLLPSMGALVLALVLVILGKLK